MEFKVDINGSDVSRAVADAVVQSALGETIVKMTTDYVKELSKSYDNPIKKVIEAEVREQIVRLVRAQLPIIEEEVRKQLAQDMVAKISIAAIEKFTKSIY